MTRDVHATQGPLAQALVQLRSALELLDRATAPGQIGAHIDLAIHQLEAQLARVSSTQISPAEQSEVRH